jgi:dCMP deaminase
VGGVKVLNIIMKPKFIKYYMEIAELTAKLSYAVRLNVGAVIVKGNQILSSGYNGMPTGWENVCEHKVYCEDGEYREQQLPKDSNEWKTYKLVSKPEVLHAERNALDKVAASNESTQGAVMFCTHSPCLECAKSIYNTGITDLYYKHDYKSNDGINFLKKTGVYVHKYTPEV